VKIQLRRPLETHPSLKCLISLRMQMAENLASELFDHARGDAECEASKKI
jgi:hypothetical protein